MTREEAERLVDDIVDRAMECQQYEHLHNFKAAESASKKVDKLRIAILSALCPEPVVPDVGSKESIQKVLDGIKLTTAGWEGNEDIMVFNGKPIGSTFRCGGAEIDSWWGSLKREIAALLASEPVVPEKPGEYLMTMPVMVEQCKSNCHNKECSRMYLPYVTIGEIGLDEPGTCMKDVPRATFTKEGE